MPKSLFSADIDSQVGRVQANMNNLAKRSVKKAEGAMEAYAHKIMVRARWYAPEETGALGAKSSWRVDKQKVGNRRAVFVVELKSTAKRKDGTPVSDYASYMHDSHYQIRGYDKYGKRIASRAKAERQPEKGQPWLTTGNTGPSYVGRLYLTRAVNQYRLATQQAMQKAVSGALR